MRFCPAGARAQITNSEKRSCSNTHIFFRLFWQILLAQHLITSARDAVTNALDPFDRSSPLPSSLLQPKIVKIVDEKRKKKKNEPKNKCKNVPKCKLRQRIQGCTNLAACNCCEIHKVGAWCSQKKVSRDQINLVWAALERNSRISRYF